MSALPDSLSELQSALYAALLEGEESRIAGRIIAGELSARRRIGIYRSNVLSNLRGALKAVYPVILKLVGSAFFDAAADQYVRAHPSRCGDLNALGAEFAVFLSGYRYAQELPYLPDVARLEWAWHEVFHATDAQPLDLARLAEVPAESYGDLRFKISPALRLLNSPHPLLRIWEVNQENHAGDGYVDLGSGGGPLLVTRDAYTPVIESLEQVHYALLDGMMRGLTLEQASETPILAERADLGAVLSGALQSFVQREVIVGFDIGTA